MHTYLRNFLVINKLFFSHRFSSCDGYSTNHSLTEMIKKALDGDKFACGVFIDLQKVFIVCQPPPPTFLK